MVFADLSNTDQLTLHYNTGLYTLLNSLAPLKTRLVSFCRSAPWFTPELRPLKVKARQLERLYKKTGLTVQKEMYSNHLPHYKESISQTKSPYYSEIICPNKGNTRSLFRLFNKTTQSPDSLPPHLHSTAFCNSSVIFH